MDTFDFSTALRYLRQGSRLTRKGWNGKAMWIELVDPAQEDELTHPVLVIKYPKDAPNTPGAVVPWFANQTDVLATDWRTYSPPKCPHNVDSSPQADLRRFRWLLSGNGGFLEMHGLCTMNASAFGKEANTARAAIDAAMMSAAP